MKAKTIRMHPIAVLLLPLAMLSLAMVVAIPAFAQTRHYYIAAEDSTWDFTPSGKNLVHCHPDAAPCEIPEPWTNSHNFPVTRFIQYEADFKTPVPQPEWLGILGPIIRAEVGDMVKVHFCNRAQGSYGMHPMDLAIPRTMKGRILRRQLRQSSRCRGGSHARQVF